ncbi:MAG: hypothetical protein JSR47_20060 [Proteobacteria bacterium]|nr:hypothetical protein [Pseudomonadota bacterium]
MVVGIGRGTVLLPEYGKFIADMIQAGVIHYRKIIDVTAIEATNIDRDKLLAFDAQLRQFTKVRRGPLAVVAHRDRAEVAQAFKVMTSAERPIEIFRSIHEARAWVATFPVADTLIKTPEASASGETVEESKE